MDHARAVVESVLRGTAGALQASLDHPFLSDLAEAILDSCARATCASPYALADAMGVAIVEADLPRPLCVCVDDSTVIVRPEPDLREQGLLVFRGLARHALSRRVGAHAEADAIILAAELAAPSGIVVRRGIELVALRQQWVPIWFLRAWDEYLCPPVPNSRTA